MKGHPLVRVYLSLFLTALGVLACNTPAISPPPCVSVADKLSISDWSQFGAFPGTGSTVRSSPLELRWPHLDEDVSRYQLTINGRFDREVTTNCASISVQSSSFPVEWRVDGIVEGPDATEMILVGQWSFIAQISES